VLRKILRTKCEKVTADYRRMHTEQLYDLYSHKILLGDHMKGVGDGHSMWQVWGRTEMHTVLWLGILKRPLARPRHGSKGNIKIDLTERVWEAS